MCRAQGRRCDGPSNARAKVAARVRLHRARQALDAANASGDREGRARAAQRIHDARMALACDHAGDGTAAGGPVSLAADERRALSNFVGGTFISVNNYIENGYRVPAYASDDREFVRHMADEVASLERAVNRSVLDTATEVTRATWTMWAEREFGPVGSGLGEVVTVARFQSATFDAEPDPKHGDVTVRYRLAPGTRAVDVVGSGVSCDQSERELLIGPHHSFRKVEDRMVGGRRVIELESQVGLHGGVDTASTGGLPWSRTKGQTDQEDSE